MRNHNLPVTSPLQDFWQLVHGPLAHWAEQRPDAIALQSEDASWTFSQLHAEVQRRRAKLVLPTPIGPSTTM